MLAPLLRLHNPLVHTEVPVHVCGLLLLPLVVCLEAPPTLGTWWSEGLIDGREKVRSKSGSTSVKVYHIRLRRNRTKSLDMDSSTYCFSEDAVKLISPLVMTGGADAARLRAEARMLARSIGTDTPPAAGAGVPAAGP